MPFTKSDATGPQYLLWPAGGRSSAVDLTLINADDEPASIEIEVGGNLEHLELKPWQVYRHVLKGDTGSAIVRTRGRSRSVVVHAQQYRNGKPVSLPGVALGDALATHEITTVHVPTRADGSLQDVSLTLGNPSKHGSSIIVTLVSTETGAVRASNAILVEAAQSQTVSLSDLWAHIDDWRNSRIVVGPQAGGLAATGLVELAEGQHTELSFMPLDIVHNSGSYPLYDFDDYQTVMHLLNLGTEVAEIGIELSWNGGRYALAPLLVEPDRALAVDLADYVQRSPEQDAGGRKRPDTIKDGFVKWLVINGSSELLARTEIQPRGSEDRFGINCETCCWEIPFGGIEPGDVVLTTTGTGTTFETTLTFQTCSGEEGPFHFSGASLSYAAPYSWNSYSVSVSDSADETLSFTGTAQKTTGTLTCQVSTKPIDAGRRVDACRPAQTSTHCTGNKCDPAKTCDSQTTTCSGCQICCDRIKQFNECKDKLPFVIMIEYDACIGVCANTHC